MASGVMDIWVSSSSFQKNNIGLKTNIFCYNHEISSWILAPIKLEAVEASLCQFFEKRWMKLKFPTLLKPLGTIIQQNYWPFYPSEPFSFIHFNMIHPVDGVYLDKSLGFPQFLKSRRKILQIPVIWLKSSNHIITYA